MMDDMTDQEERPEPPFNAFPHETMLNDVCPYADGELVCHLIEDHEGDHWDDWAKRYWSTGPHTHVTHRLTSKDS